jgi:hypothetical protein
MFSASPLVQRDLRAADATCSSAPLVRPALATLQRPDRYARVLVLDAACICGNNGCERARERVRPNKCPKCVRAGPLGVCIRH